MLLGALTHQAVAIMVPARQRAGAPEFVARARRVSGPVYATAVCILWVLTFIFGAWIYTKYRIYIRIPMEEAGYWKTQEAFELKEHAASLGLGLLPIYWYLWKSRTGEGYDAIRKGVTLWLCIACWFIFIIGHIVNNVRGFGS
jgi:hypothetical protein